MVVSACAYIMWVRAKLTDGMPGRVEPNRSPEACSLAAVARTGLRRCDQRGCCTRPIRQRRLTEHACAHPCRVSLSERPGRHSRETLSGSAAVAASCQLPTPQRPDRLRTLQTPPSSSWHFICGNTSLVRSPTLSDRLVDPTLRFRQ